MSKIIEFGSVENPEYPRSLSDAIILRNVGVLKDGTDMNGKSLTELINKLFVGADTFKFLHCSDTHSATYAIDAAYTLMEDNADLRCCIVTGDILPSSTLIAKMQLSGKYLTLLGNHDVSNSSRANTVVVAEMVIPVCQGVTYGDPVGGAGYFHKDFSTARGRTIRFIAFDEYEHNATGNAITGIATFSQAQMDWFINLLKDTPSDYFIVLCVHQPVDTRMAEGYENLFTSELAEGTFYRIGGNNAQLIPDIMDAYLSRGTLSGTYQCGGSTSITMSIDADFTQCSPAKFLFYMGGHMHMDALAYLYNHPTQLQILIDRDGNVSASHSDLTGADANYCLNQYTINMETGDILIQRIGRQQTVGGNTRDEIEI